MLNGIYIGSTDGTHSANLTFTGTSDITVDCANINSASKIVQGTPVTASGTAVDFTSIPSWVKRITVEFVGISTNGTSLPLVQIGTSSGVDTSGYLGGQVTLNNTQANQTAGFGLHNTWAAAATAGGAITITNQTSNTWCAIGGLFRSDSNFAGYGGGTKTLSGTLDRIRITTVNGTDTFDAGTINIIYEG